MTEKRFVYNIHKNSIESSNGDFFCYVDSVDGVKIVEMLNCLNDENEQLKQKNRRLQNNIEELTSEELQTNLEKENEQLKQQLYEYKEEYECLKKENEQLTEISENLVNADANREYRLKRRIEELEKENEQLQRKCGKQEEEIEILSETLATKRNTNEVYEKRIIELEKQIADWETSFDILKNENRQLKQYKILFEQLQLQLKGVKRPSDLDSKDFDDLLRLSKGEWFEETDEHIGWKRVDLE